MAGRTDEELEALARASLDGDPSAFARLSLALWPFAASAGRRGARGADAEDEAHEVFVRLLERLEGDNLDGLRTFVGWKERHPEKTFADWIRIVASNLSRDRVRERVGRVQATDDVSLPTARRLLNELASLAPLDDVAYRPPITSAQTAREIVEFAAAHLPPVQARALAGWIQGEDFAEIRERLALETEQSAAQLVRAAIATLRRRFAPG